MRTVLLVVLLAVALLVAGLCGGLHDRARAQEAPHAPATDRHVYERGLRLESSNYGMPACSWASVACVFTSAGRPFGSFALASRSIASTSTCTRCGRAIPWGQLGLMVSNEKQVVVFRGCVPCLGDVLEDYARITSTSLVKESR